MISYVSHVMTLANSIIGVSVLAMPFCFKQCGIILAIVVLILCSLLSRLACHFLIKSAVMSRRRNYEFLAFHAFGPMGKFFVELFIIGFLLGTCIAFFVVIGDLGPQIIGKLFYKNPEDIRLSFLLTIGALIIFPLGLLRNIDSLASICTVTIGFYLCLVLKVFGESTEHIFRGDWYDNVNYWKPSGILQCLPIFSMALFCQTQLFEIYESIPNVTLEKMNVVVRGAINICTLVYISVGVFGYIGFCMQPFSGNILMSFKPSMASDVIKIGFVLSVVFSFPLVIFPCRASLHSLLFRRGYMHESASNYIPEIRFRCLTFIIVTVSLITGLLMPNIEFVLGFVGSTIGVMICLIFPAGFFISISTKNTNERLMAQVILFIGMWIMILGSYANLYAIEDSSTTKVSVMEKPFLQLNNIQLNSLNEHQAELQNALDVFSKEKDKLMPTLNKHSEKAFEKGGILLDPDVIVKHPIIPEKTTATREKIALDVPQHQKSEDKQNQYNNELQPGKDSNLNSKDNIIVIESNEKVSNQQESQINSDAIRKEESEIAAAADQVGEVDGRNEKQRVQETLEKNNKETKELLKELEAIRKHKEDFENEQQQNSLELGAKKVQVPQRFIDKAEAESNQDNVNVPEQPDNVPEPQKAVKLPNNEDKQSDRIIHDRVHMDEHKGANIEIPIKNDILPQINVNKAQKDLDQVRENLKNSTISSANILAAQPRGPILNALTNRTVLRLVPNSSLTIDAANKNDDSNTSKVLHPLPIALKYMNQTKEIDAQVDANQNVNEVPVVQRDILEDHAREKRDVDDSSISRIENSSLTIQNLQNSTEKNQELMTNSSNILTDTLILEKKVVEVPTTDTIIKTNTNLSEQKYTDVIKLDSNSDVNANYQILKKRDLKAVNSSKTRRKLEN